MAPDRWEPTPTECPEAMRERQASVRRARGERPTLSDIRVEIPSLPPPPAPRSTPPDATEAERLWQEVARQGEMADALRSGQEGLDRVVRALAASYGRDRLPQRIRAWATLVVAVGGAVAAILGALR